MTFCLNIIKQNKELPIKPSISDVIRRIFQKEQKREKKVLIVNAQYLGKNSQCSQKHVTSFFRKTRTCFWGNSRTRVFSVVISYKSNNFTDSHYNTSNGILRFLISLLVTALFPEK